MNAGGMDRVKMEDILMKWILFCHRRWLVAEHFGQDLKCGGSEVAVGACSSGRNEDCPGAETVI